MAGTSSAVPAATWGLTWDIVAADSKMNDKVRTYLQGLVTRYCALRGQHVGATPFWNVVMLTAADERQQLWYQAQLERKVANLELPLGVDYKTLADPVPGLGSGGATFNALQKLQLEYGNNLEGLRILLLHAGGFSKRMPAHSCGGKVFAAIPQPFASITSGTCCSWDVLDLKLALYMPFIQLMPGGGVFVSASDDVEIYDLEGLAAETEFEGITALAHPTTLDIASGHGVFIVPPPVVPEESPGKVIWTSSCIRVLQKPSEALMRREGAIFNIESGGGERQKERVLSDSAFWIGPETTKKFLQFASSNLKEILQVQTCIYTDFLQLMGQSPNLAAVKNVSASSHLKDLIVNLMSKSPLRVLVLWHSAFFHLGTSQEYMELMKWDSPLLWSLGAAPSKTKGLILSSILPANCVICSGAVVEMSLIECPHLVIPCQTILSHCHIDRNFPDSELPPGFLFHTVPVRTGDGLSYVTVAFAVGEDPKGGSWEEREFISASTRSESFVLTLRWVQKVLLGMAVSIPAENGPLFNMPRVLTHKDMESFLEFRCHVMNNPQ